MPNSASGIVDEQSVGDPRSAAPSGREPVRVSVDLSPGPLFRSGTVWLKLLHTAAIPLIVGATVGGLEGEFAVALLRQAWPVMGLLAAAYAAATVLHAKLDRFPFVHSFEAALVSAGLTLVPAGALLAGMARFPIDTVGLLATGGSIGWFFVADVLHPLGSSQLLVLPGGAADRLLALPDVAVERGTGQDRTETRRLKSLDGIVADPHPPSPNSRRGPADYGAERLPVYHAGPIYQLLTARIPPDSISGTNVDLRPGRYQYAKRALDVILVVLSLPVTVPLIAVTALAIRVESRGPVLLWQERVGRGGDTFQMAKLRSMRVDHEGANRAVFADEDVDRITTVGRFIRRTRLDELPQIWNVLKGEMSLIGPRPEQVRLAENFAETLQLYHARHFVRPGITGWAQVLQGYAADLSETRRKLEHDLYYVKHRSPLLDLLIIYLTLKTVLTGYGAR